jgi:hypothetical protein
MEKNKKYKFIAPSPEEEKAFKEDLELLVKKHSFSIEIIPQFKPNTETKAYEITGLLLLQKIVEDVEVVVEGAVPSTDKEVNPNA